MHLCTFEPDVACLSLPLLYYSASTPPCSDKSIGATLSFFCAMSLLLRSDVCLHLCMGMRLDFKAGKESRGAVKVTLLPYETSISHQLANSKTCMRSHSDMVQHTRCWQHRINNKQATAFHVLCCSHRLWMDSTAELCGMAAGCDAPLGTANSWSGPLLMA